MTRLYFSWATSTVTPAYHASWTNTSAACRYGLSSVKGNSDEGVWVVTPSTTSDVKIGPQLISGPMLAGVVFPSGSANVQCLVGCQESTANSHQATSVLRIFSRNGSTLRATLCAFGNYDNFTGGGPKSYYFMTAGTVMSTYTTVAGDRIVLELGALALGLIDTAYIYLNSLTARPDFTSSLQGAMTGAPWIDINATILFETTGGGGTTGMMVNTGSLGVRA